ncbi:hypothetical protein [Tabrizicola sp.]|uniref:hypothetical protein n=1 Tax=Tabrizicola sp. TaxID=2005166 RepID=UPI003F32BA2E
MNRFPVLRMLAAALLLALPSGALAESPAALVADGNPWAATMPNGRDVTITFFPDGRVTVKMGMMSRKMTWQPTEDGLCLFGGPGGDRCIRLEPTANGFVGFDGEEQALSLSR